MSELIHAKKLPIEKIEGNRILLNPDAIIDFIMKPDVENEKFLEEFKKKLWEVNPAAMQAIQEYGSHFTEEPWQLKKFYLSKVKSKKFGFLYYVRYLVDGKAVPSNWCTHTNDREAAERWAEENRERLLANYFNRDNVEKTYGELYSVLRKYYKANSIYLKSDANRGRALGEKVRLAYDHFIVKRFIPFLKKSGITKLEQIDTPLLSKFRNELLNGTKTRVPIKTKTAKKYICCISQMYDNFISEGYTKINPVKSMVHIKKNDVTLRGCYEITKLKGVFNKKWDNQIHYLLCLIINTTGIGNSEIKQIKVSDIFTIGKIHFIDINGKVKTVNRVRIVPIHDFVYSKIMAYIRKMNFGEDDLIFGNVKMHTFIRANAELGKYTKYTPEKLKSENITFYSGRHFWKTLMDSEHLGDVEEYFMGHKVSGDVSKSYNHKDKQGKKKLLERAEKVFEILNKYVFK